MRAEGTGGDLLYAQTGADLAAALQDIGRQAVAFFAAFETKAPALRSDRVHCPCEACQHISQLRLKVFLHQGAVVFKKIRQFEELAGEEVILVHRLLKNSVPSHEYILMTEAFHTPAGNLPGYRLETREEVYSDMGRVPVWVFYPVATR